MDKAALVGIDVAAGRELLAALDASGMVVQAAYWRLRNDDEDWRMYIVTPTYDPNNRYANHYHLRHVLDETGSPLTLSEVHVLSPEYRDAQVMKRAIGSDPGMLNRLIRTFYNNGEYILGAYVYRMNL